MAVGAVSTSSSGRDLLSKNPQIDNVVIAAANVESSFNFASNLRKFTLKCRSTAKLQIAFVSTQSGTNYLTLSPGAILTEENFEGPITIWFQADRPDVVEILTWQKL